MESSSTCAYLPLAMDLLCNEQDFYTLFHRQAWSIPAIQEENMLPSSGFASAHTCDCAGPMGIPQHAPTNADSRRWLDKNPSYADSSESNPLLLSKDSKPILSHVEQMMASPTRNGGVDEAVCANSSLKMTQMLPKLGSFKHTVGLTVGSFKVGIHVCQDVHALSMDPKLTERAANISCLSKQASFTSSKQLAQIAADSLLGNGGKLALPSSKSSKAESQENLTKLPSGLRTRDEPICTVTNIAKGCHLGLQGAAKQTARVSPATYATSQVKEEPPSMDNSDENFSQEASTLCDTNGRCDTTTKSVNKGKKRTFKDRSMDDAAQLSNVKSTENNGDRDGKRHKSGGETSEEDQKVEAGNSTPSLGIESSKPQEPSKPDYIHVRARRGQATDSHSLAERVRREKISEKMKFLQDLVPGCSKVTGKALMLDEIINYVQSLQRQVEFLSLKLASGNSVFDFHLDGLFASEVNHRLMET